METPLVVVAASEGERAPEPEAEVPGASDCPEGMVFIPGGTFMMGSNGDSHEHSHEQPPHSVTVDEFCMDETEVTVDAYARCSGCSEPGTGDSCNWGESGKGNHPINCVDWHQATQYCEMMGKRLPTEEEWEYAARGGSQQLEYPWGSEEPAGRACWNRWEQMEGTCAVGSYPAFAFGLKDMAGNVWEWTSSNYSEYQRNNRTSSYRVNRGGSWINGDPSVLRGAYRDWDDPSDRYYSLGFRCARTR